MKKKKKIGKQKGGKIEISGMADKQKMTECEIER